MSSFVAASSKNIGTEIRYDPDAYARVRKIQALCNNHLDSKLKVNMTNLEEDMDYLSYVWMKDFEEANLCGTASIFSKSDTYFLVRCLVQVCRNRDCLAGDIDITEALSLRTALSILSAQHSPECHKNYPSEEKISRVFNRVAGYYVTHIRKRHTALASDYLLEELDPLTPEDIEMIRVPGYLKAEYEPLQYKPPDKTATQLTEAQIELKDSGVDKLFFDAQQKKAQLGITSADEELWDKTKQKASRGYLWDTPGGYPAAINDLIEMASRVFYQFELEEYLYRHAADIISPITDPPMTILTTDKGRVQQWLQKCCLTDYSDTQFPNHLADIVFSRRIPMGSQTRTTRTLASRTDANNPKVIFKRELGPDQTQAVANMAYYADYKKVSEDTAHELYDMLLLCMFNYMCVQLLHFNPLQESFIESFDARIDSFDKKASSVNVRRPIMTYIKRKWMIHNWIKEDQTKKEQKMKRGEKLKGNWIECEDVTSMLLIWVHLIIAQYDCETDKGKNIKMHFITESFYREEEL